MATKKKLTVADLQAIKSKRKLVLVTAFDAWTAKAAEEAGVDMIGGINPGAYESQEKALRLANETRAAGTDIVYCSGLETEKWVGLAAQHVPCCAHVGYLPCNDTWLGRPRAVGKTAVEATKLYKEVMALEAAGCIAIEMECVPAKVAAEISKRTKMLVFSMGSGSDSDGQFIFAEDLLGTNSGRFPRAMQSRMVTCTRTL